MVREVKWIVCPRVNENLCANSTYRGEPRLATGWTAAQQDFSRRTSDHRPCLNTVETEFNSLLPENDSKVYCNQINGEYGVGRLLKPIFGQAFLTSPTHHFKFPSKKILPMLTPLGIFARYFCLIPARKLGGG